MQNYANEQSVCVVFNAVIEAGFSIKPYSQLIRQL